MAGYWSHNSVAELQTVASSGGYLRKKSLSASKYLLSIKLFLLLGQLSVIYNGTISELPLCRVSNSVERSMDAHAKKTALDSNYDKQARLLEQERMNELYLQRTY